MHLHGFLHLAVVHTKLGAIQKLRLVVIKIFSSCCSWEEDSSSTPQMSADSRTELKYHLAHLSIQVWWPSFQQDTKDSGRQSFMRFPSLSSLGERRTPNKTKFSARKTQKLRRNDEGDFPRPSRRANTKRRKRRNARMDQGRSVAIKPELRDWLDGFFRLVPWCKTLVNQRRYIRYSTGRRSWANSQSSARFIWARIESKQAFRK